MNNSDMPAMPCQGSINRDSDEPQPYQFGNNDFVFQGVTKREHFAGLAMQGMLQNPMHNDHSIDTIVSMACDTADALIEHLENTK